MQVVLILLAACSSAFREPLSDGSTSSDSAATSNTDTISDSAAGSGSTNDLPDLLDRTFDASGCETLAGDPTAGAATWFWGQYIRQADGSWTGQERWIIKANSTWIDAGGTDCEADWTATANETPTGACSNCDLGLAVSATLQSNTCPSGLSSQIDDFQVEYAIRFGTDGTATWYFADDAATPFASGYEVDGAVNFLTDQSCVWF